METSMDGPSVCNTPPVGLLSDQLGQDDYLDTLIAAVTQGKEQLENPEEGEEEEMEQEMEKESKSREDLDKKEGNGEVRKEGEKEGKSKKKEKDKKQVDEEDSDEEEDEESEDLDMEMKEEKEDEEEDMDKETSSKGKKKRKYKKRNEKDEKESNSEGEEDDDVADSKRIKTEDDKVSEDKGKGMSTKGTTKKKKVKKEEGFKNGDESSSDNSSSSDSDSESSGSSSSSSSSSDSSSDSADDSSDSSNEDGEKDEDGDKKGDKDGEEKEKKVKIKSKTKDKGSSRKKKKVKDSESGDDKDPSKRLKKEKRKEEKKRRNIRSILRDDQLEAETLAAQNEEMERQRRLQELKKQMQQKAVIKPEEKDSQLKSLLEGDTSDVFQLGPDTIAAEDTAKPYAKDDVILLDSGDENKKKVLTDIIELSDDDDVVMIKSDEELEEEEDDEEEEEEDMDNVGTHINDTMNQRDEQGRVLINIGHPDSDPDVFLASQIGHVVKPHQIGGIRFLYDNVIESQSRFKTSGGFGCILAHSMGLGKTIQLIGFIDIFLRFTEARSALCIVPINTLQNWLAEFNMWLPEKPDDADEKLEETMTFRTFKVFVINDNHKTTLARAKVLDEWNRVGGVLLMGYEMYRLLVTKKHAYAPPSRRKKKTNEPIVIDIEEEDMNKKLHQGIQKALVNPGPDLIACDEGHRIKNSLSGVALSLKNIKTKRRIVLTGYPLQNNLLEYWCMVDFVRPNYLGTKAEFCNMFERPIMNGQCVDSTREDVTLMRYRAHVLHSLLQGFIQRRGHSVLTFSLPPKQEHVFNIRMSDIQRQLYKKFMECISDCEMGMWASYNPLKAFSTCCKIWNHPDVMWRAIQQQKSLAEDNDLDFEPDGKVNGVQSGKRNKKGGGRSHQNYNKRSQSHTDSNNSTKKLLNSNCCKPNVNNCGGGPNSNNSSCGTNMNSCNKSGTGSGTNSCGNQGMNNCNNSQNVNSCGGGGGPCSNTNTGMGSMNSGMDSCCNTGMNTNNHMGTNNSMNNCGQMSSNSSMNKLSHMDMNSCGPMGTNMNMNSCGPMGQNPNMNQCGNMDMNACGQMNTNMDMNSCNQMDMNACGQTSCGMDMNPSSHMGNSSMAPGSHMGNSSMNPNGYMGNMNPNSHMNPAGHMGNSSMTPGSHAMSLGGHMSGNTMAMGGHMNTNTIDMHSHMNNNNMNMGGHMGNNTMNPSGHMSSNPMNMGGNSMNTGGHMGNMGGNNPMTTGNHMSGNSMNMGGPMGNNPMNAGHMGGNSMNTNHMSGGHMNISSHMGGNSGNSMNTMNQMNNNSMNTAGQMNNNNTNVAGQMTGNSVGQNTGGPMGNQMTNSMNTSAGQTSCGVGTTSNSSSNNSNTNCCPNGGMVSSGSTTNATCNTNVNTCAKTSSTVNTGTSSTQGAQANVQTDKRSEVLTLDWVSEVMKDYTPGLLENGGKMVMLFSLIEESLKIGDKLLVFSQSLTTLNVIEEFLNETAVPRPDMKEKWCKNKSYFRLDGSTSAGEREKLINQFNARDNNRIWLFLLSTRAGCLGINLIGANRVVIFDASWNPCHDCQAVCRVYRYGQEKHSYIYRLITDNSLEKKIYDRQINKQGMSDRVVDELNPENQFTRQQVDSLLHYVDQDLPHVEMKGIEECTDYVMKNVLLTHGKWLSKEPFTHESLLLDQKSLRLTRKEKQLAKQGYVMEKKMNLSYSRQSYQVYYSKPGQATYYTTNAQWPNNFPGERPVASVKPIISTPVPMSLPHVNFPLNQMLRSTMPGQQVKVVRPGVSVHQIVTTTDIMLPGSGSNSSYPDVIPAGQQIHVIKTPRGVYIRTNKGKIFAVRSKPVSNSSSSTSTSTSTSTMSDLLLASPSTTSIAVGTNAGTGKNAGTTTTTTTPTIITVTKTSSNSTTPNSKSGPPQLTFLDDLSGNEITSNLDTNTITNTTTTTNNSATPTIITTTNSNSGNTTTSGGSNNSAYPEYLNYLRSLKQPFQPNYPLLGNNMGGSTGSSGNNFGNTLLSPHMMQSNPSQSSFSSSSSRQLTSQPLPAQPPHPKPISMQKDNDIYIISDDEGKVDSEPDMVGGNTSSGGVGSNNRLASLLPQASSSSLELSALIGDTPLPSSATLAGNVSAAQSSFNCSSLPSISPSPLNSLLQSSSSASGNPAELPNLSTFSSAPQIPPLHHHQQQLQPTLPASITNSGLSTPPSNLSLSPSNFGSSLSSLPPPQQQQQNLYNMPNYNYGYMLPQSMMMSNNGTSSTGNSSYHPLSNSSSVLNQPLMNNSHMGTAPSGTNLHASGSNNNTDPSLTSLQQIHSSSSLLSPPDHHPHSLHQQLSESNDLAKQQPNIGLGPSSILTLPSLSMNPPDLSHPTSSQI